MSEESVSLWIEGIKEGDEESARRLWDRYFQQLIATGRNILRYTAKRGADEEDVALSAFKSFCMRAKDDKFPHLNDRDDLWKILLTITIRKAYRTSRKEGKRVETEQDFFAQQLQGEQPLAEFTQQLDEEIEHLLNGLDDERIRTIAIAKLEGDTLSEIAEKVGRSISFVQRKIRILQARLLEDSQ